MLKLKGGIGAMPVNDLRQIFQPGDELVIRDFQQVLEASAPRVDRRCLHDDQARPPRARASKYSLRQSVTYPSPLACFVPMGDTAIRFFSSILPIR